MTGGDTLISIIATVGDDGEYLREFVADALNVLKSNYNNYELVLIDDGTGGATALIFDELLREHACLRIIRLSKRYGSEISITAGLDAAIGDYVVVMRPQSDPPSAIPDMVRVAASGWGIVLGTSARRADRGPLVSLCRKSVYWFARRVLDRTPPPNATGFCVLSRPFVNAVARMKSKDRHLCFLSCAVGFDMVLYPYEQINRSSNLRIRPLREAINEHISILISNSTLPLRLASHVGAFAATLNLVYVAYVLLVNLIKHRVAEGWTTLSLQFSIMFFLIFVNFAIISEYIAHILRESQDRPLYHVLEERTSSIRVVDPQRRNIA